MGSVRLPLAGPYRPRAQLYRRRDGTLEWVVRLWEVDRPIARTLPTEVLLAFARLNGLRALEREIEGEVAVARRPR